jgi:GNAT superfamily N-acetyltransferase
VGSAANIGVRLAVAADIEPLTAIMLAMERYYEADGIPDSERARRRIAEALFGPAPIGLAFLALEDGRAVGVALCCWLFPTKEFRPGLFLKDMFVADAHRGRGIGRALLAAVAEYAEANDLPRVDWTADRGNAAAAGLYSCLGARVEDKLFFRIRRGDYAAFIARAKGRDGV